MSSGPITIEIRLDRFNKTYCENEAVSGHALVKSKTEFRHDGIVLDLDGSVQMQLSGKNAGFIEAAFSSTAKPLRICEGRSELEPPGRIVPGTLEFPFSFPLKAKGTQRIHETYHGVFVAIQYTLRLLVKRSFPAKSIEKSVELMVELAEGSGEAALPKPLSFTVNPESVQFKERGRVPAFALSGRLDSVSCRLGYPLTGEVTVRESELAVKSLDLQLVRLETCGAGEAVSRDATEVQTLQIGEGDVERGLAIPIFMVFPRLFACPTTETPNFRLEFQLNIVLVFANDFMIKESFPLTLHRH